MSSPSLVELKAILRLAGPLIAAQLAYVAMVFTDTVMMSKLGPDALAAGGLRFPAPVKLGMSLLAKVMTKSTYRI